MAVVRVKPVACYIYEMLYQIDVINNRNTNDKFRFVE